MPTISPTIPSFDDDGEGCKTGYTKVYCDGSNLYYAGGCDSCDETCVADDITSQTDGQYYCDADDPWTFYHVDEDGVLRNDSTLSGSNSSSCIWIDCSVQSAS